MTKEEKKWLNEFQKLMNECPESLEKRARSYTIGDNDICIYNAELADESGLLDQHNSNFEVCTAIEKLGAEIAYIYFPFNVESTCG